MTMLFIKLGCIEGLCVLAATISTCNLTYFAVKYKKQRLSCHWSIWQYEDFGILQLVLGSFLVVILIEICRFYPTDVQSSVKFI